MLRGPRRSPLGQRLATMDIEPTYSETAAESLFRRGLADRMTPAVQAELKQIGIDLARPFAAAYPQEVWERGVQCVATRLYGDLPAPQAHTEVGRRYMAGFQHTLLGRATTQLGRLIGPERTLHRMQRNQRTSTSFNVLEIEKVGATHFRIHSRVEPAALPRVKNVLGENGAYLARGIYLGVLELLAVKNPQVAAKVVNAAEYRFEFDLTWDP
jgi:uncharacterized protein (TIGR02265 family)